MTTGYDGWENYLRFLRVIVCILQKEMFLLNMFARNTESEEEKCDKITFKVNLSQNLPQFQDWSQEQVVEQQELTPSNPLYFKLFPQNRQKYVQYITNQNDTLLGMSIKLDINEATIRQINDISGNIYPGMKILLPEQTDLSKLEEEPADQFSNIKTNQLLSLLQKTQEFGSHKYAVSYYAGLSGGYIRGNITLNTNYFIFNPSLDHQENVTKFSVERLLKFNAIVEIADIQEAAFLQIPEMGDAQIPAKISVVQFLLYRVGNTKMQKKYKARLKQLKLDHKAIASMSFTVHGFEGKEAPQMARELVSKINEMIAKIGEMGEQEEAEDKNRLTNIPFFDIIHANIHSKNQQPQPKEQLNKVIAPSTILGTLAEASAIVNQEEFSNLVLSMPVIYQLYNWNKVYGSTRDGSSFTTFLNRSLNVQPAILLIKQYKGYKFGAFLIENLQMGKTGRGEMFIFTFRDKLVPEIYQWTGKNEQFVNVEKDMGVGIGMGFKYGIFLKNDLDRGSSSGTRTFGNAQRLSKKQDFLVEEIEVWGIDFSY